MFGSRRKRGSSNPPLNGSNANPSAATAAAQAFLKNQASNAALASAAAGAALRSRPTTPTSVADVQTKRNLRRSGSTSSMGSSVGSVSGGSRPTLQRKGSTGSMTERTFRDQSPSQAVPSAPDAPPVPAIPKNIPAISPKPHRRAASLEAPPVRVTSPTPNKANGRGSSLGPGTSAQPPTRAGQRVTSLSSVQELTGLERPESRGTNPPRITSSNNQDMIYDPNSRRFIPAEEHYAIERALSQRIQDAANKPVKKMKKVAPQQFTGTHLADGTIGGRPRGTAVDAMEAAANQTPTPLEQPIPPPAPAPTGPLESIAITPKKKKKKKVAVASDSESDQPSYLPASSADESDLQTNGFHTRAGTLLAKKPSIVQEDREREEQEDDTPKARGDSANLDTETRAISPTPLPRSAAGRGHGRGPASASAAFAQDRQQTRSASQPAPASAVNPAGSGLTSNGSVRVQSVSPARTALFATTPDSLVVKHQPPPRSISPRKSALKRSNSPRESSPGDEATFTTKDSSEMPNGSVAPSDELQLPRKKAVRVSFDETNVIVGQAAAPVVPDSPIVQSPQQAKKSSWFSSIGRSKKRDVPVVDDNDDEVMKPRPALPSFGSVREKKSSREPVEERQLVKPAEPVESTSSDLQSPTLFTTPTGEGIDNPLGQSHDHNVGALLSQDASLKKAANISKSREPLPPQVLYGSDTDSSVSDQTSAVGEVGNTMPLDVVQPIEPEIGPSTIDRESESATPTGFRTNIDVPEIAVLEATPTFEHPEEGEWPDMHHVPGGWNASSTSDSGSTHDDPTEAIGHINTDPTTPATVGVAEPPPKESEPGLPVGQIAAENTHAVPAIMEETDESDASIYSDAAEDFFDGDGDGFQSLNAVVESPIVASAVPGLALTTPPESPTIQMAKDKGYKKMQLPKTISEPNGDESWETTQEYWKGLSAEQKRQLEQEARDEAEAGEDSDSTIEAKPAPKPKKKKKVQPVAAEVPTIRQPVSNERTYMIQPGSKAVSDGNGSVMRTSMRSAPPNIAQEHQVRKSMRGPGSAHGSLRQEENEYTLSKKNRPVSLPAPKSGQDAVKTHVRNLSAASAAAASNSARRDMAPKPAPVLRHKSSGDSDTSFKRARRTNERLSMRRSMRGPVDERPQSPARSSRFSLRSLSPTGSASRKPFNSGSESQMRNSLRGSVGAAPTLRAPKPEKSSRIPGFGRSSSTKPAQKQVRQRSSRFADSSDEDVRPAFRSRFADSDDSDDDVPAPRSGGFGFGTMRANAPVRGIPKRVVEDGDSSDLPDSDDERNPPKPPLSSEFKLSKNRQNGSTAVSSAQGLTPGSGSLRRSGSGRDMMGSPMVTTAVTATPRPSQNRRGSFMSTILRRKNPDPSSKVRKSDAESAARRDTPLERSRSDLMAVKRQDSSHSATGAARPYTPKLQKKGQGQAPTWPLVGVSNSPPKIVGGEDGRPFTADDAADGPVWKAEENGPMTNGINGNVDVDDPNRPDLGTRRFSATGLAEVDFEGKGGPKKKKFGALRRMFRLDE